jgi:hypothetical protein
MKKKRHGHNQLIPHQGEPEELAARLTPPEERPGGEHLNEGGAIVVDMAQLKLPKDFADTRGQGSRFFGLDPLGVIILIFALAFIGLITYLIYTEQPPPAEQPTAVIETER